MKFRFKTYLVLIVLGFSAQAYTDIGKEGGGGDLTAADFVDHGIAAYRLVRDNPATFPEINLQSLSGTIRDAEVVPRDKIKVKLAGKKVELPAHNNGSTKIEVSRALWPQLNTTEKLKIALHEYLGLMGLETNNYYISVRILEIVRAASILKDGIYVSGNSVTCALKSEYIGDRLFLIWASNSELGYYCEAEGQTAYSFDCNNPDSPGECVSPETVSSGFCPSGTFSTTQYHLQPGEASFSLTEKHISCRKNTYANETVFHRVLSPKPIKYFQAVIESFYYKTTQEACAQAEKLARQHAIALCQSKVGSPCKIKSVNTFIQHGYREKACEAEAISEKL